MASTVVADAILDQLVAGGVRRVYGVVGDAIFPLAAAFAGRDDIAFVATAHEAGAAFMASYEAKLTGALTACVATSGPGATNLATGLADAYLDGAPVLAITGQVDTAGFGTSTKQYFDQQTFFRAIAGSTDLALAGEAAMHAVLAAMGRSMRHRTVAHLSIPRDVFGQAVAWTPVAVRSGGDGGPAPLVLGDWASAVGRLAQSRCPLVVVGTGEAGVVRAALSLARGLGAGIVAAQQAKGAVPFDDPQLIGGIGEAHVPEMVARADILVLVGDAPYEVGYIPAAVPAIVVSERHVPLTGHPLLAEAVGALSRALRALEGAVGERRPDAGWSAAIAGARQGLDEQVRHLVETDRDGAGAANPYRLAMVLSEVCAPDAVIAVDIGAFAHWFDLGFRAKRQAVLISTRWRGMGAALPAAIAACLACPGRQVIAVVGDGAFVMSMAELTTAVARRLPVTIVVVNNGVYDLERQKMGGEGLPAVGTALCPPDFVAYAEACGAAGMRVDGPPDALAPALERGLRETMGSGRPVVIDVRTGVPALPHLMVGG